MKVKSVILTVFSNITWSYIKLNCAPFNIIKYADIVVCQIPGHYTDDSNMFLSKWICGSCFGFLLLFFMKISTKFF